jgi:hypothetical protein
LVDHLLAKLEARIRRCAETGGPSVVLDPAALDEASQLWEATQPADRDPYSVPVDVLEVLANLHLSRCKVLPEGHNQADLQRALNLFSLLLVRHLSVSQESFGDFSR